MPKKISWKYIPIILLMFFTITFILFETAGVFTLEDFSNWVRLSGPLAGLAIFFMLLIDIIIPVPSSILMALSGNIYGFFFGTIIGFLGSISASFAGFFIAKKLRKNLIAKLIGIQESHQMNCWFEKWGGPGIIISRMVPMVSETISFLAGFSKMTWKKFFVFTIIGTLPPSIYYAYFGSISKSSVGLSLPIIFAFIIFVMLWTLFKRYSN